MIFDGSTYKWPSGGNPIPHDPVKAMFIHYRNAAVFDLMLDLRKEKEKEFKYPTINALAKELSIEIGLEPAAITYIINKNPRKAELQPTQPTVCYKNEGYKVPDNYKRLLTAAWV